MSSTQPRNTAAPALRVGTPHAIGDAFAALDRFFRLHARLDAIRNAGAHELYRIRREACTEFAGDYAAINDIDEAYDEKRDALGWIEYSTAIMDGDRDVS